MHSSKLISWFNSVIGTSWWELEEPNNELRNDFVKVFSSAEGKRVFNYLAHYCCGAKSCWDENSRKHAFSEGKRDVFLQISNWCEMSERALKEYRREAMEEYLIAKDKINNERSIDNEQYQSSI